MLSVLTPDDIVALRTVGRKLSFGLAQRLAERERPETLDELAELKRVIKEYFGNFQRYVDAILAYCARKYGSATEMRMARACFLTGHEALTIAERCELNGDVGYIDFGSHVGVLFQALGAGTGGLLGGLAGGPLAGFATGLLGWWVGARLDKAASVVARKLREALPDSLVLLFERDPALTRLRSKLWEPRDWAVKHLYTTSRWST